MPPGRRLPWGQLRKTLDAMKKEELIDFACMDLETWQRETGDLVAEEGGVRHIIFAEAVTFHKFCTRLLELMSCVGNNDTSVLLMLQRDGLAPPGHRSVNLVNDTVWPLCTRLEFSKEVYAAAQRRDAVRRVYRQNAKEAEKSKKTGAAVQETRESSTAEGKRKKTEAAEPKQGESSSSQFAMAKRANTAPTPLSSDSHIKPPTTGIKVADDKPPTMGIKVADDANALYAKWEEVDDDGRTVQRKEKIVFEVRIKGAKTEIMPPDGNVTREWLPAHVQKIKMSVVARAPPGGYITPIEEALSYAIGSEELGMVLKLRLWKTDPEYPGEEEIINFSYNPHGLTSEIPTPMLWDMLYHFRRPAGNDDNAHRFQILIAHPKRKDIAGIPVFSGLIPPAPLRLTVDRLLHVFRKFETAVNVLLNSMDVSIWDAEEEEFTFNATRCGRCALLWLRTIHPDDVRLQLTEGDMEWIDPHNKRLEVDHSGLGRIVVTFFDETVINAGPCKWFKEAYIQVSCVVVSVCFMVTLTSGHASPGRHVQCLQKRRPVSRRLHRVQHRHCQRQVPLPSLDGLVQRARQEH